MRSLLYVVAAACSLFAGCVQSRDYDRYDYYALHVDTSKTSPEAVARHFNMQFDGQLGQLVDHFMFRAEKHHEDVVRNAVKKHKRQKRDLGYSHAVMDAIQFNQKQKLRPPMHKRGSPEKRQGGMLHASPYEESDADADNPAAIRGMEIARELQIRDPLYSKQWHLYNPKQPGHDLNVTGVWLQGVTGKNTYVAIVDDGLDFESDDLKDNYYAEGSYDFNDKGPDPKPRLSDDRHGTRCAGEVSAVKNDVCGVGVAWDSKIAGIRILSAPIADADEAEALNYGYNTTQIYSCSWGPPDDGKEMGAPGVLITRAMVNAVQNGRGGLGSIYVFAAGNGANSDDNCNFDGYTNSIYSVTVGAIDREGAHPYYSEACSAQLVVTYSSGAGDNIHTTGVGKNHCYDGHGGTSAAGPLAVGLFALVLEVRPDLTWRDIQWLSVLTAVPFDDGEWQDTPLGKKFSHQFGYGKLDAWALVEAARDFESKKPQAWFFSPWQHVRHPIPQVGKGLSSKFTVTADMLEGANFETLEHVTVTMNVNHTRRGDLSVELRSPAGIVSHLSTPRRLDEANSGYVDWTFMSVAHWGENPEGDWTVVVKDNIDNEHKGVFTDWKLNLYGECKDASIQGLLPLPTEHDDDDHDREDGAVGTMTVDVPTLTGLPGGNPSDHFDRPINQKPSDADAVETPTITSPPTPTGVPMSEESFAFSEEYESAVMPTHTPKPPPDDFLPSPFPNFGVSKKTQIWIYGSAGLIFVFCISLAVYLIRARRKRQRDARDNYEFEILGEADSEDEEPANGAAGGRRGRRKARDLYDAFAGESDEEVFSEDEKYADRPQGSGRGDEDEKGSFEDSGSVRRHYR